MLSNVLASAKLSSGQDFNASLSLAFFKLFMAPIRNMDDVLEEITLEVCGNCVRECVGVCRIRALNQQARARVSGDHSVYDLLIGKKVKVIMEDVAVS